MKSKLYTRLVMVIATVLMFSGIAAAQTTIVVPIVDDMDDVEEIITAVDEGAVVGDVDVGSSDLELGFDHDPSLVGLLFRDVQIPKGATITNAYVQFTVDAISEGSTDADLTLEVYGAKEVTIDSLRDESFTVSSHPSTSEVVEWSPPPSVAEGDAGEAEQTPDLSTIITEIIALEGWTAGNNILIVVAGDPYQTEDINREMEAYDSEEVYTTLNVTFDGGTGVNSLVDEFSYSVYPNPAEGMIHIDNPSSDNFSFEIFNINGQLVASKYNLSGSTAELDMSGFAKGMYFVDVKTAERTATHKLILK